MKSEIGNKRNLIRIVKFLPVTGVTKNIGGGLSNGTATADDLLLNPLEDTVGEGAILWNSVSLIS